MKKYLSIIFVLSLTLNTFVVAQESEGDEAEISTVEALLQLVKEGKTKEQSENADREAKFMANKNEQAAILAAEKRELARQERIADQLEAEYKKNEEILRVKPLIKEMTIAAKNMNKILSTINDEETLNDIKLTINAASSISSKIDDMSDDFEKLTKDKELTKSIRDLTIGLSKFLNEIYP